MIAINGIIWRPFKTNIMTPPPPPLMKLTEVYEICIQKKNKGNLLTNLDWSFLKQHNSCWSCFPPSLSKQTHLFCTCRPLASENNCDLRHTADKIYRSLHNFCKVTDRPRAEFVKTTRDSSYWSCNMATLLSEPTQFILCFFLCCLGSLWNL